MTSFKLYVHRPGKDDGPLIVCLALFLLLLGCLYLWAATYHDHGSPAPARQPVSKLTPGQRSALEQLIAQGYIRADWPQGQVFVDPVYWNAMDAQGKANFALNLADADAEKTGLEYPSLTILDNQSAKVLATLQYDWTGAPKFSVPQ